MLGRAAGLIAATYYYSSCCALGVGAFLLPPGANEIGNSLLAGVTPAVKDIGAAHIRIPCSECAFTTKNEYAEGVEEMYGIEGGAKEILFDVTISEDGRRVEVDGSPIYPRSAWRHEDGEEVVVHQVSVGNEEWLVPVKVTSQGVFTDVAVLEDGKALVSMRYQVYELEDQAIQLRSVRIHILKTGEEIKLLSAVVSEEDTSHRLDIEHDLSAHPFHPPHGPPPPPPHEDCGSLPAPVCRFRDMLKDKIQHLRGKKPCPGDKRPPHSHLPSHIRPPLPHRPAHGEHPHPHPHPPHGRPHHRRPWYGAHKAPYHGPQSWAEAFMRGFIAVLVPVVAGVFVGLFVSLLGLLVARAIGWTYVRCRQPKVDDWSTAQEGKILLLPAENNDDVLPAYDHAPAYDELEAKVPY